MRIILPSKLSEGRLRAGTMRSSDADGFNGVFIIMGPCGEKLTIIASDGTDPAARGWQHVSISTRRLPNWTEMCFVKDLFWDEEECVVQFHPPKSEYVTNHPNVLHLWKHMSLPFPQPPSILVGIKEDGEYANKEEALAGYKRAQEKGIL
jgi:hypothetical protein